MKKKLLVGLVGGILLMASLLGKADASVYLEFGSGEGLTHGKITSVGGTILDLGNLELKNLPFGDFLLGVAVEFSPIVIDPNPVSSVGGIVLFDAWAQSIVSGFALYADVVGDSALELIMTADLYINNLLVIPPSTGFINTLEIAVDLNNFQLYNTDKFTVPSVLNNLVTLGIADLTIGILAPSNNDLSNAIQNGNLVRDIVVSGTIAAVPEPAVMALFAYGLVLAVRYRKKA
ncbi:MAG: hypothetical protein RBU23_07260 [Candidatus Auribacterota bacterium]|jgi:hypothetical protein|nr:hypothetical protein [Candidatus Auribacterota bacterium]